LTCGEASFLLEIARTTRCGFSSRPSLLSSACDIERSCVVRRARERATQPRADDRESDESVTGNL